MMMPARYRMMVAGGALALLLLPGCMRPVSAQQPGPGTVFRDCEACPEMVVVPPGSFMMGSPRTPRGMYVDEGPRHRATIGYPLAVGVFEVTFAEWDAGVSAGGCWNETYAGAPADGSAWSRGYCVPRVVRGGSWNNPPGLLRSAFRDGIPREDRGFNVGFRVARSLH
ncbi:MAG: SUMF1/EgtB/PvdO family nonheme iron enzyme [Gammaproteobacteria bacterium]|nr:SUMF1/EgtB/PvdO family nonheme iron enzyme [Gammaproteobacteria bacterium]MDE0651274.1 SUMF1/EgtB/PvdO family nonheme iron enzyme [Gammaproteobacteria bacterium]